jgi:hypothetical protein
MKHLENKLGMTSAQIVIAAVGLTTTTTLIVWFIVMAIINGIKLF